ncbi:MAG: hypothetical protein FWD31_12400, partial [Planctomycetaceae bacterium]|nr:hypothetical protein [Planctomycetaceae bacterium]
MKSISKTVKMILVVSAAFLAPWVYMTGGEDIIAMKNRLLSGIGLPAFGSGTQNAVSQNNPEARGSESEAIETPPIVITYESIQHKDDVELPLPSDLKLPKAISLGDLFR